MSRWAEGLGTSIAPPVWGCLVAELGLARGGEEDFPALSCSCLPEERAGVSVFSCSCWRDENNPRALSVCKVKEAALDRCSSCEPTCARGIRKQPNLCLVAELGASLEGQQAQHWSEGKERVGSCLVSAMQRRKANGCFCSSAGSLL